MRSWRLNKSRSCCAANWRHHGVARRISWWNTGLVFTSSTGLKINKFRWIVRNHPCHAHVFEHCSSGAGAGDRRQAVTHLLEIKVRFRLGSIFLFETCGSTSLEFMSGLLSWEFCLECWMDFVISVNDDESICKGSSVSCFLYTFGKMLPCHVEFVALRSRTSSPGRDRGNKLEPRRCSCTASKWKDPYRHLARTRATCESRNSVAHRGAGVSVSSVCCCEGTAEALASVRQLNVWRCLKQSLR